MIIEMRRVLKKARWIWFFVAAALAAPVGGFFFAFWKNPSSGKTIGYVNDLPIWAAHYQHTMVREQMYRAQLAQYGFEHLLGPVSPANTVRACAEDALLDAIADKHSLAVSGDKLHEILSSEGLAAHIVRGDGKVDMSAYRQLVASTFGTDIETYEAELKAEVKRNVLREIIKQSAYSPRYLRNFEREQESGTKKFAILPLTIDAARKKVENEVTTDVELRAFYEKNKQSYLTEEVRIVRSAQLKTEKFSSSVEVSEYDMSEHYNRYCETRYSIPARYKVRVAFHQFEKGISKDQKEELSKIFSSIEVAVRDQKADLREVVNAEAKRCGLTIQTGVSGTFELGSGTYHKKVEQAIGWLKNPGDVSQVIVSEDTLYLVQLESKIPRMIKPFEEVRTEIKSLLKKRLIDYRARNEIEKFMRSCYDNHENFDDFLKEHNLKVTENKYSSSDKKILETRKDGAGKLIKAVFEWNRSVPYVGYVQEEDRYILFSLDRVDKPKTKPFEEVKGLVRNSLLEQTAKQLQARTAKEFHRKLLTGKIKLDDAAVREWGNVMETGFIDVKHQLKKPDGAAGLVEKAFEMTDPRQVLKYSGDGVVFLVKLLDQKKGNIQTIDEEYNPLPGIITLQGFVASMLQTARIDIAPEILGKKVDVDEDYSDY